MLATLKLSPLRSLSHDRSDLTDMMRSNHVLSNKQIRDMRAAAEKQQREDVAKVREINKVMKRLGKEEHQKNIELFQKYNEEEKEIVNVLLTRERERNYVDNLSKKLSILSHYKIKKLKDSQLQFAQAFH